MKKLFEKNKIHTYEMYCTLIDGAVKKYLKAIYNSCMMSSHARQMIEEKRLFYIEGKNTLSIFCKYPGMYLMSYFAEAGSEVDFKFGRLDMPVVIDHMSTISNPLPKSTHDFLLSNGFCHIRKDYRLTKKLDTNTGFPQSTESGIDVQYAKSEELGSINELLKENFDPCADRLPSDNELAFLIDKKHVFVMRENNMVIAASIRVPYEKSVHNHWIACHNAYRKKGLATVLFNEQDKDSFHRGYNNVTLWINSKSTRWIEKVTESGYYVDNHVLDTYIRNDTAE